MIIRCSIENWMSFRNRVSFSMIAGRERQHGARVPRIGKYKTKILPVAAIYGGNASGKTNFFKALSFVKRLVVNGTQTDSRIPVDLFRLDSPGASRPARFVFELLIDETIYEFSFAVTPEAVLEEKLVLISGNSEKVLYDRRDGKPNFGSTLKKNKRLQFVFDGTRDNQLFLTNSVSQKVEDFRPIYDWFKSTLILIAPDTKFESFDLLMDKRHPLYSDINNMLSQLDTGIARLSGEEIPIDRIPLDEQERKKIQTELKEGMNALVQGEPLNERWVITRKNGELIAKKMVTYHLKSDGTEARFETWQESAGSQRVIDLVPAFLEMSATGSKKVYFIDEVDRSLHTLLTRHLLDTYLAACTAETRAQLLFTTHDVLLMDQKLLRRDEMWVTERDAVGVSNLNSFSDYKDVRYDKDIRKSYLQGRMGGIPRILLSDGLAYSCRDEESRGGD
ncbi:MAG: AAA family ATPase [Deltaproteobacteria bacterium]|nr:AAA family ATPase [Deltaproteobacteria bacterium]